MRIEFYKKELWEYGQYVLHFIKRRDFKGSILYKDEIPISCIPGEGVILEYLRRKQCMPVLDGVGNFFRLLIHFMSRDGRDFKQFDGRLAIVALMKGLSFLHGRKVEECQGEKKVPF